ncbi:sulfite exporter TauE/SafE family protein [Neisseria sp. Ec49-e6-T10]|uniref:sulfite exporter TauE/SafE family protein n=1 Tax=Neisseria sp. Ec49-e6-T10 TaxID=3140744 RepID=UPI003EBEB859
MLEISLLSLFLMGLAGGGHCAAMCGGLSTAFALQLPPKLSRYKLILLLNLGRISSYILIGAILGGIGQLGIILEQGSVLRNTLFVIANVLLILWALYLMGISSTINKIEGIGRPIWRLLNRFLQKLLPIRSAGASFFVGMIWGWLPCGMVYTASIYSLSSGSVIMGALCMASFALGTLPNLLAIGIFAATVKNWLQKKPVRMGTGLFLICFALWQIVKYFQLFH